MPQTYRTPRGWVGDGTVNECTNPALDIDASGYLDDAYYGPNGAGTYSRIASQYAIGGPGTFLLQRQWTTAPTGPAPGAGFTRSQSWAAGNQKSIGWNAGWFNSGSANLLLRVVFKNASGAITGQVDGATQTTSGNWVLLTLTATAPAGTTQADIKVMLDGSRTPPVNGALWASHLIITQTAAPVGYFDGSTTPTYANSYAWSGARGLSASYRLVPDPASVIVPILVLGWDDQTPSNVIVHQLLSGAIQIVTRLGGLRTGTLQLFFGRDRAAASNARAQHRLQGVWTYLDGDLPETNMTYVVTGPLHLFLDDDRLHWTLEVPFQEVNT